MIYRLACAFDFIAALIQLNIINYEWILNRNWGKPERAPHRRVGCGISLYILYIIYRTSCRKSLAALILRPSTFRGFSRPRARHVACNYIA